MYRCDTPVKLLKLKEGEHGLKPSPRQKNRELYSIRACVSDIPSSSLIAAYGVMGHELVGDLFRERRIKAPTNVDCRQFLLLALVVWSEFRALTREVGLFGVCL
jgi:hypothetical protein